jgi:hypothetical protein
MGTTWVLDTATKGTGATMVPLERVTKRSTSVEPVLPPRKRPPRPTEEAPSRPQPRRFKVVDLMSRQALVDDAPARETVDALTHVRSVVDIDIYAWQEDDERWRRLTYAEKHLLWELAGR